MHRPRQDSTYHGLCYTSRGEEEEEEEDDFKIVESLCNLQTLQKIVFLFKIVFKQSIIRYACYYFNFREFTSLTREGQPLLSWRPCSAWFPPQTIRFSVVSQTAVCQSNTSARFSEINKEGNVLFNDALNAFLFTVMWRRAYGKGPITQREKKHMGYSF